VTGHRRARALAGAVALAALAVIVYQPAWRGDFVWDDDTHVVANPAVTQPGKLGAIWTDPDASPQYYPLTFSLFRLQFVLWEYQPAGYHAVNLALHVLCALLLWRLLAGLRVPWAWLGAAAFTVHPLNVMSVAWITELKNVLCLTLMLAAALALLRPWQREAPPPSPAERTCAAMVFVLVGVLALLAKTAAILLVPGLLLVAWVKRWRWGVREGLALAAVALAGIGLGVVMVQEEAEIRAVHAAEIALSAVERFQVFGHAFWFYLGKVVHPHGLAFFYPKPPVGAGLLSAWFPPFAAVAVLVAAWLLRRRTGRALPAVLWFYALAAPGVVLLHPLYMMRYTVTADHWFYFAAPAMLPLLAGYAGWWTQPRHRRAASTIGLAALVVLTAWWTHLARRQAATYRDYETLLRHNLRMYPASWVVSNNLGLLLGQQGRCADAIALLQQAARLRPESAEAWNNLGSMVRQCGAPADALEHFQRALYYDASFLKARFNLGETLLALGRADDAVRQLAQAGALAGRDARVLLVLGEALGRTGRWNEAFDAARIYTERTPNDVRGWLQRGVCAQALGLRDEAERAFRAALARAPDHPDALNNLAWLFADDPLATPGEHAEALAFATRAVELAPDHPYYRGTLAAALAASGRPAEAAAQLGRAIDLAGRTGDAGFIASARERLAGYEANARR
jgi:Flp pilus assembly protein TadD